MAAAAVQHEKKVSQTLIWVGGCSFKCITCGIDVVLWRRQIVTILNSCFCQTRQRTIWLFPSDISCELPKTGKLSRTDKWMSNTAKGCSDPHILIRDELARKTSSSAFKHDICTDQFTLGWDFYSELDQEFWCEIWKKLVGLLDLFTAEREKSPTQKRKKSIEPAVINDDPGSNAHREVSLK